MEWSFFQPATPMKRGLSPWVRPTRGGRSKLSCCASGPKGGASRGTSYSWTEVGEHIYMHNVWYASFADVWSSIRHPRPRVGGGLHGPHSPGQAGQGPRKCDLISGARSCRKIWDKVFLLYQGDKVLSNFEWHIAPVLNPDGYAYTFLPEKKVCVVPKKKNIPGSNDEVSKRLPWPTTTTKPVTSSTLFFRLLFLLPLLYPSASCWACTRSAGSTARTASPSSAPTVRRYGRSPPTTPLWPGCAWGWTSTGTSPSGSGGGQVSYARSQRRVTTRNAPNFSPFSAMRAGDDPCSAAYRGPTAGGTKEVSDTCYSPPPPPFARDEAVRS